MEDLDCRELEREAQMPFDGLTYLNPAAAQPKTSVWTRAWMRLTRRGETLAPLIRRQIPVELLDPIPINQAELTLRVLKIGRALVADPRDWTKRYYETLNGRRCAVGALRAAARVFMLQPTQTAANAVLLSVAMRRGFDSIEKMNDNSTHREALSAFDEAIARASYHA